MKRFVEMIGNEDKPVLINTDYIITVVPLGPLATRLWMRDETAVDVQHTYNQVKDVLMENTNG